MSPRKGSPLGQRAKGRRAGRSPAWNAEACARILQEMVGKIVAAADPMRVILFGSAARGDIGPESDLDFLVVVRDEADQKAAWDACYRATGGYGIPVDLLIVSVSVLAACKDDPWLVYRAALAEGRELVRSGNVPEPVPLDLPPPHREWMDRARGALAMAALDAEGVHFEAHCLQAYFAAEWALKAACRERGILFGRDPGLEGLMGLLAAAGLPVPARVGRARSLARYADLEWVPRLDRPVRRTEWAAAVRKATALVEWAGRVVGGGTELGPG